MRKGWLLALVFALAVFVSPAAAQAPLAFDSLRVQLWPEYDQPAVLVIYDFQVGTQAQYPQTVRLTLPAEASLLAVAQQSGENLLNLSYDGPTAQGNVQVLTVNLPQAGQYHVEYYQPLTKNGANRSFTFVWPGDYPVSSLDLALQQPPTAEGFQLAPALPTISPAADGFVYQKGSFGPQAAGKEFRLQVSYAKPDDTLSVSNGQVQPSGDLNAAGSGGSPDFSTWLPWVLGGLGVALLLGGLVWYWFSGRASAKPASAQHHRHAPAAQPDDEDDAPRYCPQCGKRAHPSDRFCRVCGTKMP